MYCCYRAFIQIHNTCTCTYNLWFVGWLNFPSFYFFPINSSEECMVFDIPFTIGATSKSLLWILGQELQIPSEMTMTHNHIITFIQSKHDNTKLMSEVQVEVLCKALILFTITFTHVISNSDTLPLCIKRWPPVKELLGRIHYDQ